MRSRKFLFIFLATLLASANASEVMTYNFRVLHGGSEIGTHTYTISQPDAGTTKVHSEADFSVSLFFIPVYDYLHKNTETWKNGCIQNINATTNDNGTLLKVSGYKQAQQFVLKTLEEEKNLDSCVRSFAYWKPEYLNQPYLLNPQTGELEEISLVQKGLTSIKLNNTTYQARQYQLVNPKFTINLWYSDNDWLALESRTSDGNILRYERMEPVS